VPTKDSSVGAEAEGSQVSGKQVCLNLIVGNFQMLVEALLFVIMK